jgi:hypothetical protein
MPIQRLCIERGRLSANAQRSSISAAIVDVSLVVQDLYDDECLRIEVAGGSGLSLCVPDALTGAETVARIELLRDRLTFVIAVMKGQPRPYREEAK